MQFTPKTEKEIQEEGLLPEGVYDFEVVKAEEKTSKAGNQMIELSLHVFDASGKTVFVRDFLMESLAYKLRHCADACGLIEGYESGALIDKDFVGKCGKVKIVIQKDKEGKYPDKNVVRDYIKREGAANNNTTPAAALEGDGIPF
jgi:hypothetical protein